MAKQQAQKHQWRKDLPPNQNQNRYTTPSTAELICSSSIIGLAEIPSPSCSAFRAASICHWRCTCHNAVADSSKRTDLHTLGALLSLRAYQHHKSIQPSLCPAKLIPPTARAQSYPFSIERQRYFRSRALSTHTLQNASDEVVIA